MPEHLSVNQKILIALSGGMLIGALVVGLAWMTVAGKNRPSPFATSTPNSPLSNGAAAGATLPPPSQSSTNADEDTAVMPGSSAVADDQAAGNSVRVQHMNLKEDLWVAVHRDLKSMPGGVNGAYLVPAGTVMAVVPLVVPTLPGSTYYIALYRDNGDKKFSRANEIQVANGGVGFMRFRTLP